MNKIFNWTLGSIFRTLGRIIAYIGVGLLIGFIINKNGFKITDLLGIYKVNASTITPTTNQYMAQFCDDRTCDYTISGSSYSTSYINMGTSISNNNGSNSTSQYLTTIRFRQILNSSNYLQIGTQYTFQYKVNFNGKNFNAMTTGSWDYILVLKYSNNSSETLDSGDYSVNVLNISEDTYAFYINLIFTPTQNVQQVDLVVQLPFYSYMDYSDFHGYYYKSLIGINYTRLNITYAANTTDAINQQTTNIINNQNSTTEQIINNQNNNTESIINNNNENTQQIIDSNKSCNQIDKSNVISNGVYLGPDGRPYTSISNWGITDYININNASITNLIESSSANVYLCFYNVNKAFISCINENTLISLNDINLPNNSYYVRFTINLDLNKPTFKICKNGNQAIQDTLTDDNVNGATDEGASFFNDFTTNTHGLTGIITAPLNAINSLTSSTCTPLHLPIPYLTNKYLDLPCMRPIYVENFGGFMTLYDTITLGIVSYWIMVRIFALVKDFKNPDHDEIEVVDL